MDTPTFKDLNDDYFDKACCPLHPNAREYLMKDVIQELERLYKNAEHKDTSQYMAYERAISLIKGVR